MSDTFDVSNGAAYAVLFCVLAVFTVLAVLSAGFGASFLPVSIQNLIVAHGGKDGNLTVSGKTDTSSDNSESSGRKIGLLATDFFLSARSSTGTFGIAMSFFASGMGAWVVYGTTEMGATPQLSWLGVLGYSIASAVPGLCIAWLGPLIKQETESEAAFSTTDFCKVRYGRVMQLVCAAISIFYMWIFLVAELTSISNIFALLRGMETFDWYYYKNLNVGYTTGIAVSIGVFTIFYTGLAGLPASIVTDKFQAIIMGALVLLLTIAVCASPVNHVSYDEFKLASNWTADGFYALVILVIAILSAELFNQSNWQRVWAAKDDKSLRHGYAIGSSLVFLLMMFFGIMGMIAYAKDPTAYDNFEKYAYLSFFDLLLPLKTGWHILVLILVTALAASSIDSLQNGITCALNSDLLKTMNPTFIRWVNRVILIAVNAAAIVKSAQRYDVLGLFLVADLVCATTVFPVFLGLMKPEKFGKLAPTEFGAFMGCISGIATVLVSGVLVDSERYGPKPFEWFWLKDESAICALCGTNRMWTFIVTPVMSIVFTFLFSFVHIAAFGETIARKPILNFAFDQKSATALDQEEGKLSDDIEA